MSYAIEQWMESQIEKLIATIKSNYGLFFGILVPLKI